MTESQGAQWAGIKERGHYWGMALLVVVYRFFGRWVLYPLVGVVVTYFFLTRRSTRRYSAHYLARVLDKPAGLWRVWRHHLAFGASLMDRVAAWMGRIQRSDVAFEGHHTLLELQQNRRGAVLLGAHFGTLEMCRAVVENDGSLKLNVLLHGRNTRKFNRVMGKVNSKSQVRLIPVQEITPATAIHLRERLDEGEFVILLADRLPPGNPSRTLQAPFLGSEVQWPAGPFWLALMLGAPVFFIAACHTGFCYQGTLKPLYGGGKVPRREREAVCQTLLQDYVRVLENLCRRHPYQWFNFYDYWRDDARTSEKTPELADPKQP
jgi:predicted LPLAT superfamily acyltransferase